MLPPINSLLQEHHCDARAHSEPCSPFFSPARLNSFKIDDKGVIKLPPLLGQVQESHAWQQQTQYSTQSARIESISTPRSSLKRAQSCSGVIERSPVYCKNVPETPNVFMAKKPAYARAMTPSSMAKTPAPDSKRAFAFITHSQDTFPSKEPAIDNAPLARRKRRRTSKHELNILQSEFELCPTPDKFKRIELSERCCMSEKAIQIWFQNKRQSVKRQQKAVTDTTLPSDNSAIHTLTPLAAKPLRTSHAFKEEPDTPPASILDTSNIALEPVTTPGTNHSSPTNARQLPHQQPGRGQALTFRLKNDTKTLTPIRTSPNNRVNKLINGNKRLSPAAGNVSPTRESKCGIKAYSGSPKRKALHKIDVNTLRS